MLQASTVMVDMVVTEAMEGTEGTEGMIMAVMEIVGIIVEDTIMDILDMPMVAPAIPTTIDITLTAIML